MLFFSLCVSVMVPFHFRRREFTVSGVDHQAAGIPFSYFSYIIIPAITDNLQKVRILTSLKVTRDAVIITKYFKFHLMVILKD